MLYLAQVNKGVHISGCGENPEAHKRSPNTRVCHHVEASGNEEQVNVLHVIQVSTSNSFNLLIPILNLVFSLKGVFRIRKNLHNYVRFYSLHIEMSINYLIISFAQ